MVKPTKLRTCTSIGSRTRSKRPDAPAMELPLRSKPKKRVQSKLKVKRKDEAADDKLAKKATESDTNKTEEGQFTETIAKKRRVIPHEDDFTCEKTDAPNRIGGDNESIPNAVAAQSNVASSTNETIPSNTQPTPVLSLPAPKPKPITVTKATPRQNSSIIRRRNITPSPSFPLTASPAFPTTWQSLSHTTPNLPEGVINISSQPHSCCLHSLQSHRGYSWLTSQQRCGCHFDSDHNTSECLTQVYYGHYVDYTPNDWEAEAWWLSHATLNKGGGVKMEEHVDYMERQPHLNAKMRAILMDWMVEMSMEYGLHAETVHLSTLLVDRALACVGYDGVDMVTNKEKLQCVGCACTLIASKLLEITPPTVQDFCYISDNSYTTKEILECEANICSALKFNFNYGTPFKYIDMFLRVSFASRNGREPNVARKKMVERMVSYFVDLSLLEYKFVAMKPSLVAAAALYLARATLGIREAPIVIHSPTFLESNVTLFNSIGYWTKTLEHYTGYDKWDLEEAVKMLRRLHENAENNHLKSIYNKYKSDAYGNVALKTVLNEEDLGFL